MMNLEKTLETKIPLKLGADGSFRMLMIADIQEQTTIDSRTVPALAAMLDRAKPDLVILGGDNVDGRYVKTEAELRTYFAAILPVLEERGIAWAHIYGNHDYDAAVTPAEQMAIYGSYPHCITKTTPGIPGVTNYLLPVLGEDGEPVFLIWAFDTQHYLLDQIPVLDRPGDPKHKNPYYKLSNNPIPQGKFASPGFEQQMWYWQTSRALEEKYGRKIPGMMVMHVAPWEFSMAKENPEETGLVGFTEERLLLSSLNTGIFATALQRGDIGWMAAGHTHADDFTAAYCGMNFALVGCGGYTPKGNDACRGGRLFTWKNGELTTEMIRYQDNPAKIS